MRQLGSWTATYYREAWEAWNRFWFAPTDPATLGLIRVLAGGMLLYTHLTWSIDLGAFFGPDGWIADELVGVHQQETLVFDLFRYLPAAWMRWSLHVVAVTAMLFLCLGFFSRTSAVISWLAALAYVKHVSPGAYFGLDKVNLMLAMYLMLGPCGARYSLDRLLRLRRGETDEPPPSGSANLAIRLMQVHLCVMYLFAGLGKLKGNDWWEGTATWYTVANDAYRSWDMTWLAGHLDLLDLLTHLTVAWEVSYCFLVWNRWTRPWLLAAAIGAHLFIAFCLGMQTFGWAMIFANLSFFSPVLVRYFCDPLAGWFARLLGGGAGEGGAAPA